MTQARAVAISLLLASALGSATRSPTPSSRSATTSASSRADRRLMMRTADRLRFSTSTMRNVIATAHSSPMLSGWTFW